MLEALRAAEGELLRRLLDEEEVQKIPAHTLVRMADALRVRISAAGQVSGPVRPDLSRLPAGRAAELGSSEGASTLAIDSDRVEE